MAEPALISIKEMFAYINSGKPFSMVYVKADKQKGIGGGVKHVQHAIKNYSKAQDSVQPGDNEIQISKHKRNANHFFNSTLNIRIPAAGGSQIRTAHVQLIRVFNGATVK